MRGGAEVRSNDTERWVRSGRVGILESVPEGVDVTENLAADLLPVSLGVLYGWNSQVRSLARDGVSGLSDPDILTTGSTDGRVVGLEEQVGIVLDSVGLGGLEVGVRVDTEPVNGADDGVVGAIHPSGPGVNMADREAGGGGVGDGRLGLANEASDLLRRCTDTAVVLDASGRNAVQVFRADGEANHEIGESATVLLDGALESRKLVVKASLTAAGPHSQKKAGLGSDGGRNGRDGVVGGAALDHGVQTRGGEVLSALEGLLTVEDGLEI